MSWPQACMTPAVWERTGFFAHSFGQGVHVRPDGHPRAGAPAREAHRQRVVHGKRQHLEGGPIEEGPQRPDGLDLPAAELRMLVELPAKGRQRLRQELFRFPQRKEGLFHTRLLYGGSWADGLFPNAALPYQHIFSLLSHTPPAFATAPAGFCIFFLREREKWITIEIP